MKTLIVIGALLTLTGATLASNTGSSGTWMFQAGLVFLFGAVAILLLEDGRQLNIPPFGK